MPGVSPRPPEQFYYQGEAAIIDFHVNELAADQAGSLSPFGPELEFPLPVSKLRYTHPGPKSRPNLADGR